MIPTMLTDPAVLGQAVESGFVGDDRIGAFLGMAFTPQAKERKWSAHLLRKLQKLEDVLEDIAEAEQNVSAYADPEALYAGWGYNYNDVHAFMDRMG